MEAAPGEEAAGSFSFGRVSVRATSSESMSISPNSFSMTLVFFLFFGYLGGGGGGEGGTKLFWGNTAAEGGGERQARVGERGCGGGQNGGCLS
jgi:hypothetical protein